MALHLRPAGPDIANAKLQRSQSMTTDRPSISAPPVSVLAFLPPPPAVTPEPAYIAAAAASQIVTSEHKNLAQRSSEENGAQPVSETALVTLTSLGLVNAFLDQLLFNFLACARSTSLASLRPAISEVLRPRLAKEAIGGADEELQEFLGGGDEEELSTFHNGQEPSNDWDLELVWKRTRLRCMVYTRLGDMEEEDEERYIEQERLENAKDGHGALSRDVGIVSPAVAIFLTSILEFIGEQCLMVAGEAAYNRILSRSYGNNKRNSTVTNGLERMTIEQIDMEKVAFNSTLGRLWRTWRKLMRSPASSLRPLSRESIGKVSASSSTGSRKSSFSTIEGVSRRADLGRPTSVAEVLNENDPAAIPLPMSQNDAAEIDVPGYVTRGVGNRGKGRLDEDGKQRPQSMLFGSSFINPVFQALPTTTMQSPAPDATAFLARQRSHSLPTPQRTPYYSPTDGQPSDWSFATPMEGQDLMHYAPENGLQSEYTTPIENPSAHVPSPLASDTAGMVTHDTSGSVSSREAISSQNLENIDHGTAPLNEEEQTNKVECESESMLPIQDPPEARDSSTRASQAHSRDPSSAELFRIDDDHAARMLEEEHLSGHVEQQARVLKRYDSKSAPRTRFVQTNDSGSEKRSSSIYEDGDANVNMTQGHQRHLSEESSDHERSRLPFTFAKAPASHSRKSSDTSILSGKDLQPDGTVLSSRAYTEHGGPLTPLREHMDGPNESSKEAPWNAKNNVSSSPEADWSRDGIPNARTPTRSGSVTSALSHVRNSSNGSKLSEKRPHLPTINSGSGIDRATVQRVSPHVNRESEGPQVVRRSISSSRDTRSAHTSSSGVNQVSHKIKGLIGLQQSDSVTEARRSSEENGSLYEDHSEILRKLDKQQSFEQLMKSDETIQYTLTPQNMRQIEVENTSRWTPQKKPETADLADFLRNTAPTPADDKRPHTNHSVVSNKGIDALRSNPSASFRKQSPTRVKPKPKDPASLAAIITPSTPSPRSGQAVARNARYESGTTRDFADFLRSTGPEAEASPTQASKKSRPLSSPRSSQATSSSARPKSSAASGNMRNITSLNGSNPANSPIIGASANPLKRSTPQRLQPREATIPYGDQSSDLIDFLRRGPPEERTENTPRTPRVSAPPIYGLGNGKHKDLATSSSIASTQDSSMQSNNRSSTNSNTHLLDSSTRTNSKSFPSSQDMRWPARQDNPPHPVRTQYRTADPYAIDTDSDEEYLASAHNPPKQEESLMDFLRNVTPPADAPAPPPIMFDPPKPTGKLVKEKTSNPTIRTRFQRNGSLNKSTLSKDKPRKASVPSNDRTGRGQAPQIPPLSVRETSPHADQVGIKADSDRPARTTHIDHERQNAGRVNHIAKSARTDHGGAGATQDLADFLRNSGPPEPVGRVDAAIGQEREKEESGFSRMFSRRKKSVV